MSQQPLRPEKQRLASASPRLAAARSSQSGRLPSPILQLQRLLGNQRVAQLIRARRLTPQGRIIGLQRKLTVGAADDRYEQEADRVARQVMSMPDSGSENSVQRAFSPTEKAAEEDKNKILQTSPLAAEIAPFVQRQMEEEKPEDKEMALQAKYAEGNATGLQRQPEMKKEEPEALQAKSARSGGDSFEAGEGVESRLNSSKGSGSQLPDSVRTYMEPRFGMDFSHVRVHTGNAAIQMNRDVGAQAFTHGSDIYYGADQSPGNLELTAHELTHVVQQTGHVAVQTSQLREGYLSETTSPVRKICATCGADSKEKTKSAPISDVENPLQKEKNLNKGITSHPLIAGAAKNGEEKPATCQSPSLVGATAANEPGQHGLTEIRVGWTEPSIRRLTANQFRVRLGSTSEQRAAIDALFANSTFLGLWNYLKDCTAPPKRDLGPLRLQVTPGLRIAGVERFGGYDPFTRTLEINPAKVEHVSNPAELVDTIVHELIHAVDDLENDCIQAGSPPAPLHGAATQHAPSRAAVAGTPQEAQLMIDLGPGASNPCEEFIDINAAAQLMIGQIITENIQIARVGRPTLTFVNEILRRNPAAMSEYEACRGSACTQPNATVRNNAMARCSAEIIGKFIPPDLLPSLIPSHLYFEFGSDRLRSDSLATLDLVALFLISHPAISVSLTGHADPVGTEAINLELGQRRAETVAQELIRQRVNPQQIRSVISLGEEGHISTSRSTRWKDRRVDITL